MKKAWFTMHVAGLLLPASMLVFHCGYHEEIAAGNSSEAGNAIVVGQASTSAEVQLLSLDYNPVDKVDDSQFSRTVATDENGEYMFQNVPEGDYNILARDAGNGSAALLRSVHKEDDAALNVRNAELQATGTVRIILEKRAVTADEYFYLPGTDVSTRLTADDIRRKAADLEDVPAGSYAELFHTESATANGSNILANAIEVLPDETTIVGPWSAWKHSYKITFNTTTTGAGVTGDIAHIPLLIRLTGAEFDFTGAKPDGADLRFSKPDGLTELPYEIEGWDYENGVAAVWVKMDTVYGNSETQIILIYSGNDTASARSSGTSVFDSASGFAGVWHLNEEGNGQPGGYHDATDTQNHGTGINLDGSASVEGVAGNGLFLIGDSNGMSAAIPAFLSGNVSFTLSFWMNYTYTPSRSWILYFGEPTAPQGMHWLVNMDDSTAQFGPFSGVTLPTGNQNQFDVKPWHRIWAHFATIYDGNTGSLKTYVNGALQAEETVDNLELNAGGVFSIGLPPAKYADESSFRGSLDEIRIERTVRTGNWIKLNYENQKLNSTIIQME